MIRLRGLEDEAGIGLSAVTSNFQFRNLSRETNLGMMWTNVDGVEPCVLVSQKRFQLPVHRIEVRPGCLTLGEHRLIGDDDREIIGLVEPSNRRGDSRDQHQLVGISHAIHLEIDHPIAIQENRRSGAAFKPYRVVHTARRARPSIGQRFDDEVVVGGDAAPELFGRRLGEGRLAITVDFDVGQSPGE